MSRKKKPRQIWMKKWIDGFILMIWQRRLKPRKMRDKQEMVERIIFSDTIDFEDDSLVSYRL